MGEREQETTEKRKRTEKKRKRVRCHAARWLGYCRIDDSLLLWSDGRDEWMVENGSAALGMNFEKEQNEASRLSQARRIKASRLIFSF
jgi:hypothetical protein